MNLWFAGGHPPVLLELREAPTHVEPGNTFDEDLSPMTGTEDDLDEAAKDGAAWRLRRLLLGGVRPMRRGPSGNKRRPFFVCALPLDFKKRTKEQIMERLQEVIPSPDWGILEMGKKKDEQIEASALRVYERVLKRTEGDLPLNNYWTFPYACAWKGKENGEELPGYLKDPVFLSTDMYNQIKTEYDQTGRFELGDMETSLLRDRVDELLSLVKERTDLAATPFHPKFDFKAVSSPHLRLSPVTTFETGIVRYEKWEFDQTMWAKGSGWAVSSLHINVVEAKQLELDAGQVEEENFNLQRKRLSTFTPLVQVSKAKASLWGVFAMFPPGDKYGPAVLRRLNVPNAYLDTGFDQDTRFDVLALADTMREVRRSIRELHSFLPPYEEAPGNSGCSIGNVYVNLVDFIEFQEKRATVRGGLQELNNEVKTLAGLPGFTGILFEEGNGLRDADEYGQAAEQLRTWFPQPHFKLLVHAHTGGGNMADAASVAVTRKGGDGVWSAMLPHAAIAGHNAYINYLWSLATTNKNLNVRKKASYSNLVSAVRAIYWLNFQTHAIPASPPIWGLTSRQHPHSAFNPPDENQYLFNKIEETDPTVYTAIFGQSALGAYENADGYVHRGNTRIAPLVSDGPKVAQRLDESGALGVVSLKSGDVEDLGACARELMISLMVCGYRIDFNEERNLMKIAQWANSALPDGCIQDLNNLRGAGVATPAVTKSRAETGATTSASVMPHVTAVKGTSSDLFGAIGADDQARVQALLMGGVDPDSRDDHNYLTPPALYAAASRGNSAIVGLLLSHNARVNARTKGTRETPGFGQTALYAAVERGNEYMVSVLLQYHADPNSIEFQYKKSPLMLAVEYGHMTIARMLLDAAAEVNRQDRDGNTALHYAAKKGDAEMASFLLKRNANVRIENNDNKTPIGIADKPGNHALVPLVEAARG
uniref:Uncharacterized protein n=1 Tax=Chromera velia CCMP2878 TaxID=1169474 RepID=A0A0G4F022_9ALVE|eukprot:Cvel_14520.t1-p1 / transcript=Cvel_14520.t1 / gene=Cvel_14520 / organism=Chromera_velia_CCMP2878 / gene_product=Ankyrin repeat and SOCS box protein 8, putative / transcript_product=Ankyrin repeat and SOCS box protein 8, putative / location=Cvel_scaffold1037:811-15172(-) / protein_length=935 / sequence_SO=supercontig / SO=protein_coding / is_pseudo=false